MLRVTPGQAKERLTHELVDRTRTEDLIRDNYLEVVCAPEFEAGTLEILKSRKNLRIVDAGVFWPTTDDPLFPLVGTFPFPSSDHRLVWVDVWVPSY